MTELTSESLRAELWGVRSSYLCVRTELRDASNSEASHRMDGPGPAHAVGTADCSEVISVRSRPMSGVSRAKVPSYVGTQLNEGSHHLPAEFCAASSYQGFVTVARLGPRHVREAQQQVRLYMCGADLRGPPGQRATEKNRKEREVFPNTLATGYQTPYDFSQCNVLAVLFVKLGQTCYSQLRSETNHTNGTNK